MRADDAAGERGDRGDEQDPAEPPFPHGGTARWASRNGARRFTASIWSNYAAVMSSSGWTRLSPALLTSTFTGPSASVTAWTS